MAVGRYDTQCKGDRICERGRCVAPGAAPAPVWGIDTAVATGAVAVSPSASVPSGDPEAFRLWCFRQAEARNAEVNANHQRCIRAADEWHQKSVAAVPAVCGVDEACRATAAADRQKAYEIAWGDCATRHADGLRTPVANGCPPIQ